MNDASTPWLGTAELARICGISRQKAHKALSRIHSGKTWRGNNLIARLVPSRGGRSGLRYEVLLESLPADLQAKWHAANPPPAVEAAPPADDATARALATLPMSARPPGQAKDWAWCHQVIQPALRFEHGSKARGAAIRTIACQWALSESTVRRWLRAYEAKGLNGLTRKPCGNKGQARVLVSRRWDGGVPFDRGTCETIATKLRRKVRSLWAADAPSWPHVARLATAELVKLTRAAGLDAPDHALRRLCAVSRRFVERERKYRLIAIHDKDAKRFADHYLPRVRRSRAGLRPMDLVVADVHHTDILFRRPDGSLCTPKAIAWHDLATNRLFFSVVFLGPREGVRQEHVVQSFIDLTQDARWGVPRALYIDNGGEFARLGFVDDAMKLADWTLNGGFDVLFLADDAQAAGLAREARLARRSMIIRSAPYNAPAKPIEGAFSTLERGPFAMLPGWIGGNRMVKKTQNLGREPEPFPGSETEFREALGTALGYFHSVTQSGHLDGLSPNEAFAAAVKGGWQRTDIDRLALEAVFAVDQWRSIRQGEFSLDGRLYRHDALLTLRPGAKVRVRVPVVGMRDRLAVLDESGVFLCHAEPTPTFGMFDPSGARDKQRRRRAQVQTIREWRGQVDHLDLTGEMRAAAELHGPPPVPGSVGVIRLADEHEAIGEAARTLPARKRSEAEEEEARRARKSALLAQLAG